MKEEFKYDHYYNKPSKEFIEKQDRAFNAALAYEKNCIAKYDYPDNRPSRPPKRGERMEDLACRFGTTVQEMKNYEREVERAISNEPNYRRNRNEGQGH